MGDVSDIFRELNDHLSGDHLSGKLGKSYSFGLPRVPFVNCCQIFPFCFEGRIWDLIVSVPDHCLSFYFEHNNT